MNYDFCFLNFRSFILDNFSGTGNPAHRAPPIYNILLFLWTSEFQWRPRINWLWRPTSSSGTRATLARQLSSPVTAEPSGEPWDALPGTKNSSDEGFQSGKLAQFWRDWDYSSPGALRISERTRLLFPTVLTVLVGACISHFKEFLLWKCPLNIAAHLTGSVLLLTAQRPARRCGRITKTCGKDCTRNLGTWTFAIANQTLSSSAATWSAFCERRDIHC